jgi:hypothetical protein
MNHDRHSHGSVWELDANLEKAEISGVNIFRFANSKVAEIWNYTDDFGLREQLGVRIYAGRRD